VGFGVWLCHVVSRECGLVVVGQQPRPAGNVVARPRALLVVRRLVVLAVVLVLDLDLDPALVLVLVLGQAVLVAVAVLLVSVWEAGARADGRRRQEAGPDCRAERVGSWRGKERRGGFAGRKDALFG
jgi:hypothetical protein